MLEVNLEDVVIDDDYRFLHNGRLLTGVVREFASDGAVVSETPVFEGNQHGIEKIWHPNGRLKSTAEYRDNAMQGTYHAFFASGDIECQAEYEMGVCVRRKIYDGHGNMTDDWSIDSSATALMWLQIVRAEHATRLDG